MKIKTAKVIIERDAMTRTPKDLWPWELPLYQSKYGEEKVEIVGEGIVEIEELPDPREELGRLTAVLGNEDETNTPHTIIVYGRNAEAVAALSKAMQRGVVSEAKAKKVESDNKAKEGKKSAGASDPLADAGDSAAAETEAEEGSQAGDQAP